MDLTSEAIDKILEIGTEPDIFEYQGSHYVKSVEGVSLLPVARAAALGVASLTAIVEYLVESGECPAAEKRLVHVEDFETVKVYGPLGLNRTRECFIYAAASMPKTPMEGYLPPDTRIVELMTRFENTPERGLLVELLSKLKAERTIQTEDSGASQKVIIGQGVASVAQVAVPNPIKLKPFRTFLEVPQPESLFLVRFRDKPNQVPEVSIVEADGGMWARDAVAHIRSFLEECLFDKGLDITVLA